MISVIVVTCGNRPTLKKCLNSLRKQSYLDREIIVVYPSEEEIIGLVDILEIVQDGKGIGNARNCGIKVSQGEIIAFTDDDCITPNDWLEKIVNKFKEFPELDYLGGEIVVPKTNNIWLNWIDESYHLSDENIKLGLAHGCNMAFRKDVFRLALFDNDMDFGYDDADIERRLNGCGVISNVFKDIVVEHRHRSNFLDFTLMRMLYVKGKVYVYKKQGRELFNMTDLLTYGFFFSLFFTVISPNIVFYIVTVILFGLSVSKYSKMTNWKLQIVDLYVNWLYSFSKIYYKVILMKRR